MQVLKDRKNFFPLSFISLIYFTFYNFKLHNLKLYKGFYNFWLLKGELSLLEFLQETCFACQWNDILLFLNSWITL